MDVTIKMEHVDLDDVDIEEDKDPKDEDNNEDSDDESEEDLEDDELLQQIDEVVDELDVVERSVLNEDAESMEDDDEEDLNEHEVKDLHPLEDWIQVAKIDDDDDDNDDDDDDNDDNDDDDDEPEPVDVVSNSTSTSSSDERPFLLYKGEKVERVGDDYCRCPVCCKAIKATFIIRHLKLHDDPKVLRVLHCPDCGLQSTRYTNLIRHIRRVHKSEKAHFCLKCKHRAPTSHLIRRHYRECHAEGDAEAHVGAEELGRRPLVTPEQRADGVGEVHCEVCHRSFHLASELQAHMYTHTGVKAHTCRWGCGLHFASYGGRIKHERINHYDSNPLKVDCDICGRPFRNSQQLAKHRMTHLNMEERREFRCQFCNVMFDTPAMRRRHEQRHRDGDTFECRTCNRRFSNEKNLQHHYKRHHNSKNEEELKKVVRPKKQERSEKSKSSGSTSLICHLCGPPKLYCVTSLRRHLSRSHSSNFVCPRSECEKKGFREQERFQAHMEMHRMRECHLCGNVYKRKQNADIHLLGVHKLSIDDLVQLGRLKADQHASLPAYMTRKSGSSRTT